MNFLEKEVVSVDVISTKEYQKLGTPKLTYFCEESLFGSFIAVFYNDQLCCLEFYDSDLEQGLMKVQERFKNATLSCKDDLEPLSELKLLLKGTDFETAVWKELLNIHKGETVSYNSIATAIGHPNSVRAVGNAVGKNPIAYIVPCHRVIRKNGELGGFGSGPHRKLEMLHFEGAKI